MWQLSRQEAEEFLFREARLLDEARLEEWRLLFTDDGYYWVPRGPGVDPRIETSLVYDGPETLSDRVFRLQHPSAHAQSPPSRTRHLISNVEVEPGPDGACTVSSNFLIYEVRRARERVFGGQYEHRLRLVDGQWRIALKKVLLTNRDAALYNVTFLL